VTLEDGMPSPRWVRISGVRTRYFEAGDGESLVLVHGGGPGASALSWRTVIPSLAPSYRVIALDVLGFGETDKSRVRSEMDIARHLGDFVDDLGLGPVRIVGNSKGAYWAARMMVDRPDAVSHYVAVGSNTLGQAMGLPRIPTEGTRILDAYDGSRESIRAFLSAILVTPPSDEEIDERVRLVGLPGASDTLRALTAFNRRRREPQVWQAYSLEHRLPSLAGTTPMLLIWGRQDRFAPIEQAFVLKDLIPEFRLEVLEKSGHQAQNDEPERFVEVLLSFLSYRRDATAGVSGPPDGATLAEEEPATPSTPGAI
jgi:pimeloyl-ACP methyl ester carboxylesterase